MTNLCRIYTPHRKEEFEGNHADDFEDRGYKITGLETRSNIRPELRYMPKLDGFCGPMWDGDAIRYESIGVYNAMI